MKIKNISEGDILKIDQNIFRVIQINHSHLGRGKANVELKLKNILNNSTIKKIFSPDDEVETPYIEEKQIKFLYKKNNIYYFLNLIDNQKYFLGSDFLGIKCNFLKKDIEIRGIFIDDKLTDIILPIKTKFLVIEAPPGIKGDSQKSNTKIVTIETGYKLSVPLFIEKGDCIIVNTETGEYVERC